MAWLDYNTYSDIVTDFANVTLRYILDINKPKMTSVDETNNLDDTNEFDLIDTSIFKFLIAFLSQIENIKGFEKTKSVEILGKIDLNVKKVCIDLINEELAKNPNPLEGYSSELLDQYRKILEVYLKLVSNTEKIPWLFNYIIETIDLQCSEFVYVTIYSSRLSNEFNNEAKKRNELQEKIDLVDKRSKNAVDTINQKINDFKKETKKLEKTIDLAKKTSDRAKKTSDNAASKITETSVTVLGMFTGIVMAIVAGLLYSSSVLENINAANFNRLICVAALVGLVCYNLVSLMFRWISNVKFSCSDKEDSGKESHSMENSGKEGSGKSKIGDLLKKLTKSDWIDIIFNGILTLTMVVGFILQLIFPIDCSHASVSEWKIEKQPTCNDYGNKYISCNVCDKIVTTEILPKTQHDFETIVLKLPTCNDDGIEYQQCKTCGEITDFALIKSVEHSYKNVVYIEPTCTKEGLMHYQCQFCSEVIDIQVIAAVGHNFKSVVDREPTCTEEGLRHNECINCGEITEREITASRGHYYTEVIDKYPTNTEYGEKHKECIICGNITQVESIPATP